MITSWSFVECDAGRAKPGAPVLCRGCQHNREIITRLTTSGAVPRCDMCQHWMENASGSEANGNCHLFEVRLPGNVGTMSLTTKAHFGCTLWEAKG